MTEINKRLFVAFLTLAGLSISLPLASVGVSDLRFADTVLPTFAGEWFGDPQDMPSRAVNILPGDTPLDRRIYSGIDANDFLFDVTLVISGRDNNASIHRPERCIMSQGWDILDAKNVAVSPDISIEDVYYHQVNATRVVSVTDPRTGEPKRIQHFALLNYWFAGADTLTTSSYVRNLIDIWYRLKTGTNPQWHYVLLVTGYWQEELPPGAMPLHIASEEQQEKLRVAQRRAGKQTSEFIETLMPTLLE